MGEQAAATRVGETLLGGRYRLERHVVDDGSAEIYAGIDTRGESAVMVRLLRPEFVLRAGEIERFVALPNTLKSLSPPHVARVLEVNSDDTGIPCVVEESLAGQTLAEVLATHPDGLPFAEACRVIAPIFEAIARLHPSGVTHGAVDPRRIVLVPHAGTSAPRIAHFNIAVDNERAYANYAAPEQRDTPASPNLALDPAMDVWALGMLTHHVLTGRRPPPNPTVAQLQQALPDLPVTLAAALSEALCNDPSERLPDAAVFWMRVESALKPPSPASPPAVERSDQSKPHEQSDASGPNQQQGARDPFAPLVEETPARKPPVVAPIRPFAVVSAPQPIQPRLPEALPPETSQRARSPGSLTDAQLRNLLVLTDTREHAAWPWIRVVLLLLLLLLFYKAVPFLTEPDLAAARHVFGEQLTLVGVALSAVSVVALARTWVLVARANAVLFRPMLVALVGVVVCICVLVGGWMLWGAGDPSLMGGGGGMRAGGGGGGMAWRTIGGVARVAFPYGVTAMLLFGALAGLLQGLRSIKDATALAISMMLLSAGGAAASVDLALNTIRPDLLERAKRQAEGDDANADQQTELERIKQAFKPTPIELEGERSARPARGAPNDEPQLRERTTVGGGDDAELIVDDVKRQRAHQSDVIKAADNELPTR